MIRSKYRAIPTVVDGIRFASKKEANRYQELKILASAKKILALETNKAKLRWPLTVNGLKICTYEADFGYVDPMKGERGELIIEDVKGMKTPVYRIKKRLMKAIHGIDIQEV